MRPPLQMNLLQAAPPFPAAQQVQLVMQYCDMGTLDAAIKEGVFKDPETGLPRTVGQQSGLAGAQGL